LSDPFSLKQMREANFDEADPLLNQKVYSSREKKMGVRKWQPDYKDVMKERFHYAVRTSDGSPAQWDVNKCGRVPLLFLEDNSITKILLLRYTAWIKAMEACQMPNVFLFDFCRRLAQPNDMLIHPIIFYDLFAAEHGYERVRTHG